MESKPGERVHLWGQASSPQASSLKPRCNKLCGRGNKDRLFRAHSHGKSSVMRLVVKHNCMRFNSDFFLLKPSMLLNSVVAYAYLFSPWIPTNCPLHPPPIVGIRGENRYLWQSVTVLMLPLQLKQQNKRLSSSKHPESSTMNGIRAEQQSCKQ